MDVQIEKTNNKWTEKTYLGEDKVAKFGWQMRDEPGEFRMIDKRVLQIAKEYQRDALEGRTQEIAGNWSWLACGVLIVAARGNLLYVIDGQHRLLAARKRSDITHLPCLIFQSVGVEKEAAAFVVNNTKRKSVNALHMHHARVVSGDEIAVFVDGWLGKNGLEVSHSSSRPRAIKCISQVVSMARQDIALFEAVMSIVVRLVGDAHPVNERLVGGLRYLASGIEGGLGDKRLVGRIEAIGATGLVDAAMSAAAYYSRGGPKVWATGMLKEINRGLKRKFELKPGSGLKED